MLFENQTIKREQDKVTLSAEMTVQFDCRKDEERISIHAAPSWDNAFLSSFNCSAYNCYQILGTMVPGTDVNRLSDYKKIWGILRISNGFLDGFYDVKEGRVYWGIKKIDSFNAVNDYKYSSVFLFIPKYCKIDFSEIIIYLAKQGYKFSETGSYDTFVALKNRISGSIWLKYAKDGTYVSMTVIAEKAETWFNDIETDFPDDSFDA